MAMLLRKMRKLISQGRERVDDGEYDLDLSYITPRVLAMGLPAEGLTAAYRNPIDDVVGYLEKHHGGTYMLYNLSEIEYDASKFGDQVLSLGFPDHHAPPMAHLYTIVSSMHAWLTADPANVACIHCRAGKGRTGTIIAAYLLFAGLVDTADAALDYYAYMRARRRKGGRVSNPSQRRAVHQFERICRSFPLAPLPRRIVRLVLHATPPTLSSAALFRPYVEIFDAPGGELLASSRSEVSVMDAYDPADGPQAMVIDLVAPAAPGDVVMLATAASSAPAPELHPPPPGPLGELDGVRVAGDVYIRVSHAAGPRTLSIGRFGGADTYLFRSQLHTAFMDDVVTLPKAELDDGVKDDRLDDDLVLEILSIATPDDDAGAAAAPPPPLVHPASVHAARHGAECFPAGPPSRAALAPPSAADDPDAAFAAALEARATRRTYADKHAASPDDALPALAGHVGSVTALAYVASSATVCVGTSAGAVALHTYAGAPFRGTPTLVDVLPAAESGAAVTVVHAVERAGAATLLAVGDAAGTLSVWSLDERTRVLALTFDGGAAPERGITAVVSTVTSSGSLRLFVAGAGNFVAEVGKRASGRPEADPGPLLPSVVLAPTAVIVSMVWSSTLGLLVGTASGAIGFVRAGQFMPLVSLPPSSPALAGLAWNARADVLYAVADDASVVVFDTAAAAPIATLPPLDTATAPVTIALAAGAVPVVDRTLWLVHSGAHLVARDVVDGDTVFHSAIAAANPTYALVASGLRRDVFCLVGVHDTVSVLALTAS